MRRWEDNINKDLKDWIYLVQDMTQGLAVLSKVMNLQYIAVRSFIIGLKLGVQSLFACKCIYVMFDISVCLKKYAVSITYTG